MKTVTDWIEKNDSVIAGYTINILVAIAIFVIGHMLAKSIVSWAQKTLARRNIDTAVSAFLANLVYAVIMTASALVAFAQVGIETTSFIALLGAAGLAVGLALQGSLANFASGILIILFRPFKAGDYVEAGGVAGTIRKIEIFSTVLTSPDNKVITLPNALITGSPITNYSTEQTRRIDLVIGVSYDADLKQTKTLLTQIVTRHTLVLKDPPPTIALLALADSSVNFAVRPWVKTPDYWNVYFELMENIKTALDENNINIPYPQMDVHLRKVN